MSIHMERLRVGLVGEFEVYARLLRYDKDCTITLGNAKNVDIILIDKDRSAHYVDVKTSNTLMGVSHGHSVQSNGEFAKWQIDIKPFWATHPQNAEMSSNSRVTDYYVFHSIQHLDDYIVSASELEQIMHSRITYQLQQAGTSALSEKQLVQWDLCELCFDHDRDKNKWTKLP